MADPRNERPIRAMNSGSNKSVGLVGYGQIGRVVARKLRGFQTRLGSSEMISPDSGVN